MTPSTQRGLPPHRSRWAWSACLALLASVAVAGTPPQAAPATRPAAAVGGDFRIGAGDVLEISVWKEESLSRTLPVRPDGMITLPLLNDVRAAGLTPEELRGVLLARLAQFLPAPEVSVILREVHSYAVSVLGEVKKPGRYELPGKASVMDALAEAGGLTEFASPSRVYVIRMVGNERRRIRFDFSSATSWSGRQKIIYVEPGDTIVVY